MCPAPYGYHDVRRSRINEKSKSGTNFRALRGGRESVVAERRGNAYFAPGMKQGLLP
jgi:hypothetical protein